MLKLRLLAGALCAALMAQMPAPTSGPSDAAYAALAKSYFDWQFQAYPLNATTAGIHTYDGQLGDYSARAYQADLRTDRDYLAKLAQVDPARLSPEVALDRTLLQNAINDDLLLNGTLAQWRHNPDSYVQLASGAIFSVMSRNYAPAATRLRYAIARERAIPGMLAQAEANLTTVDAITKKISADDAAGSVDFFTSTVPQAFAGVSDASLQTQFKAANAAAASAMKSYASWVAKIKPSGTFAIGADAYRKRLLYEEGLNISVPDYLAVGEKALAQTRAQFIAVAKQVNPNVSPRDAFLALTHVHPAPDALLAKATSDLKKLRAFVIAKHIVTLPSNANITVVETPSFERETITAAEDSAGPLETSSTQAYYYVTPVNPQWSAKQKEDFLAQFNDYEFPIISAHEVYPGHFTNFTINPTHNLSLTRKLLSSSVFAEGWAHYGEQMMIEQGWGNGDPRVHLAQLDEALLRNCRYVIGVKLHTMGMTLAQAEKMFTDDCFQTPQVGVEESLRGTQDPMYGYYTLGKLMNLKLREDFKKMLGSGFTMQKFHDALLAHGDPPQPLLRPILLGKFDDGKPL